MSSAVTVILSLAGSLCATSSLVAGEALRTDDRSFRRRITARMLLSLAFLGSALAGSALELFWAPTGAAPVPWLSLLLLVAGTGATLWAYAGGPRRRGEETLGERVTPLGKLALGLLTAAQLADLFSGKALATVQQFQATAAGVTAVLGALGLVLLVLGTGAAAATFRFLSPLAPGDGPPARRLSPLAKGTFILLGLALATVGLASLFTPEVGMLLCLGLLTLGILAGFGAVRFAPRSGTRDEPRAWGISSRGWVSLVLLLLAGVSLGGQQARLPWLLAGVSAGEAGQAGKPEPPARVVDAPTIWSQRYSYGPADSAGQGSDRGQLDRELAQTRARLAALEASLPPDRRPESPAPAPRGEASSTDLSHWNHKPSAPVSPLAPSSVNAPGTGEKDRLEKDLADARKRLADLEAATKPGRPAETSPPAGAPTSTDLSKWHH
jgi:hypothetical protein